MKLIISNLPEAFTEGHLRALLADFRISEIRITKGSFEGNRGQIAIVELPDKREGLVIIAALNGFQLKENIIQVVEEKTPAPGNINGVNNGNPRN